MPRRRWEVKASASSIARANVTALGSTAATVAAADVRNAATFNSSSSSSSLDWAWDGAIPVEEVVRRSCPRAEHPPAFVRVLAQDSGPSVNAGWYLLSRCRFTSRLLHYWLELFRVYEPCKMWGQHLIQEALLVVMSGLPPDYWTLSLPCTGRAFRTLPQSDESAFEQACHSKSNASHLLLGPAASGFGQSEVQGADQSINQVGSEANAVRTDQQWEALLGYALPHELLESNSTPSTGSEVRSSTALPHAAILRQCVRHMNTQSVAKTCRKLKDDGSGGGISLQEEVGSLNSCFARSKYDWAPNAEANWIRAETALAANQQGQQSTDITPKRLAEDCKPQKLIANQRRSSSSLESESGSEMSSGATCQTSGHVRCCDGHNHFAHPVCNRGASSDLHRSIAHRAGDDVRMGSGASGACAKISTATEQSRAYELGCGPPSSAQWWSAAGAGVVLLAEGDGWVRFNALKFKTHLLWHHGHGRLLEPGCS